MSSNPNIFQFHIEGLENKDKLVPKNKRKIKISCLKYDLFGTFLIEGGPEKYANKLINDRNTSIEKIRGLNEGAELLGDPEFKEEAILVPKAQSSGELLREDISRFDDLLDNYINLIHQGWKYGFADKTYNFTLSTGYTESGRMVFTNIGELAISKEEVARHIKDERWMSQRSGLWEIKLINYLNSLKNFEMPLNLKRKYRKRMKKELTKEKLDELWGKEI